MMMSVAITTDSHHYTDAEPTVSSCDRPFKLLVKDQTFLIDSASLSKVSPVFAAMLFGKDFENGRELAREIVDEKSNDISTFLMCLSDAHCINESNFATVLRLANKYQVAPLVESCEQFILNEIDLQLLKPDQVLTLLLAANEFHLKKEVVVKLILRLASEEKTTFNRLKLSRLLPSQLYGAVIGANLSLSQAREIETMNSHLFKMERYRTQYKRAACDMCKKITNAAYCEGCKHVLCEMHWKTNKCSSDYGTRMLSELRTNIVDLEWE
uniref:BTB domain-containing protein n=1 Tax=Parascaris univalens TaxID=6257 RepID=A0A914ZG68_PARUN